jgi:palmitoyl-protein thioesterase
MFMWTGDLVVIPRESSWFASYDSYHRMKFLRESIGYEEDYVGMRTLDEAGKLWFYSDEGQHISHPEEYVSKYLIPFLLH